MSADDDFWNAILDGGAADAAERALASLTPDELERWNERRPTARELAEEQVARWGTTACETLVAVELSVPPATVDKLLAAQEHYDDHDCIDGAEILDHFVHHLLDTLRDAAVMAHTGETGELLYEDTPAEVSDVEFLLDEDDD